MARIQSTRAFGRLVRLSLALTIVLVIARLAGRTRLPLDRYVVADRSMTPTLLPGDRLLVWTWPGLGRGIRQGDVVVLRDPDQRVDTLVKRVVAVPGQPWLDEGTDGYALAGDNQAQSRDSRMFGRVPVDAVVGRVVWRYLPAERRGPVR